MNVFESETLDDIYPDIIEKILTESFDNSPRGMKTKDIGLTVINISKPYLRFLSNKNRKINPYFLFAEFLWIMTQQNRVDMVGFYNKKMYDFSDDGRTLYGAYGPRLMKQIPPIINKIRMDPNTRQAVVTIYRANDQLVATKDFPCNVMLHFVPRNGELSLHTYVRSQDVYLGLPYDFYHWSLLLEMVAVECGLQMGSISHICGSLHGYERDLTLLENIIRNDDDHTIQDVAEPSTTGLIRSIRAVSTLEYRNRKARVDEQYFESARAEINQLGEDQVIKDQLGTLLYYKVRRLTNFGIPQDELIKVTGCYRETLYRLGWS